MLVKYVKSLFVLNDEYSQFIIIFQMVDLCFIGFYEVFV